MSKINIVVHVDGLYVRAYTDSKEQKFNIVTVITDCESDDENPGDVIVPIVDNIKYLKDRVMPEVWDEVQAKLKH